MSDEIAHYMKLSSQKGEEIDRLRARLQRAEELLRELRVLHHEQSIQPPGESELEERLDAFLGERHD